MVEGNKSAAEFAEEFEAPISDADEMSERSVEATSDRKGQGSPEGVSVGSSYAETGAKTEEEETFREDGSDSETHREDKSDYETSREGETGSETSREDKSIPEPGTGQGIDVNPDHIVQDSEIPSYAGGDRNSSEGTTSREEGAVESKAHTESEPSEPGTKSNSGSSDSGSAYRDTHSRGYEA